MFRIRPDEVLQYPSRAAIMAAIQATPVMGFRELLGATGLPAGTLKHHASMLYKHGLLVRRQVGPYLTHHPAGRVATDGDMELRRNSGLVPVLEAVSALGRAPQNAVLNAVRAPRSTTQHRLDQLERAGLVRSSWSGQCRLYEVVA